MVAKTLVLFVEDKKYYVDRINSSTTSFSSPPLQTLLIRSHCQIHPANMILKPCSLSFSSYSIFYGIIIKARVFSTDTHLCEITITSVFQYECNEYIEESYISNTDTPSILMKLFSFCSDVLIEDNQLVSVIISYGLKKHILDEIIHRKNCSYLYYMPNRKLIIFDHRNHMVLINKTATHRLKYSSSQSLSMNTHSYYYVKKMQNTLGICFTIKTHCFFLSLGDYIIITEHNIPLIITSIEINNFVITIQASDYIKATETEIQHNSYVNIRPIFSDSSGRNFNLYSINNSNNANIELTSFGSSDLSGLKAPAFSTQLGLYIKNYLCSWHALCLGFISNRVIADSFCMNINPYININITFSFNKILFKIGEESINISDNKISFLSANKNIHVHCDILYIDAKSITISSIKFISFRAQQYKQLSNSLNVSVDNIKHNIYNQHSINATKTNLYVKHLYKVQSKIYELSVHSHQVTSMVNKFCFSNICIHTNKITFSSINCKMDITKTSVSIFSNSIKVSAPVIISTFFPPYLHI